MIKSLITTRTLLFRPLGVLFGCVVIALSVGALFPFAAFSEPQFKTVTPGRVLSYPRDRGAHPEYATEWWYFTGHLKEEASARTYGFELTFFRVGVTPPSLSDLSAVSAWRANSIFLAHFALTDDHGKRFFHYERSSRGAFDRAGASEEGLKVWIDEWRAEESNGEISLFAAEGGSELVLRLKLGKPVVLHGEKGFSQKGPGEGEASFYATLPRMKGEGTLLLPGEEKKNVSASAWMDQEFTSSKLARGTAGWDWFALQLESGEEVMLYHLREESGAPSPFSSGTFISKEGRTTHLERSDFEITPLKEWRSEKSNITYPAQWRLKVPKFRIDVEVTPTLAEQELLTEGSTGVTYWEGRCTVRGSHPGAAYVELVGYKATSK